MSFEDVLSTLPEWRRMAYEMAVEMGQRSRAREEVWNWYLEHRDEKHMHL